MSRLIAALINLVVPGSGLMLLGKRRLAYIVQTILITFTLFICWSRWVFEPGAIITVFLIVMIIYLLSTGLCLYNSAPSIKPARNFLHAALFVLVSIVGFVSGFEYKQYWLGIHIYFVPSASMEPTLQPGQFILLDTWAYRNSTPQIGDVVLFVHGAKKQHLVKRINLWPNGELTKNNLWYVLGDNRKASLDSRYFGGITTAQLIGEVKLILLTINKQHQLQGDDLLSPVK